jgi:drug/metabolite transporter (DMT)-like permease
MFDLSKKTHQIFTLFFLALIWGSSFILMKKGLQSYSPVEITLYRIFIVSLLFLPFGIKDILKTSTKTKLTILVSAIIGSAIPYYLFIKAQTKIDSSLNGVLNSMTPLFTLIFGLFIFKQSSNLRSFIGVITGLIGALGLIIVSNKELNINNNIFYALLPLIGSACYALNLNIIKSFLKDISAIKITSWSFMFIGPPAGLILFLKTDFTQHVMNDDPLLKNFIFISVLAILGTGFAVWLFNLLIKKTSSVYASSVTYIIPVVAIIWGLADGEDFSIIQGLFSLLILASVAIIKSNVEKKT